MYPEQPLSFFNIKIAIGQNYFIIIKGCQDYDKWLGIINNDIQVTIKAGALPLAFYLWDSLIYFF